jgi:undecaprenyl-diphosphatase
MDLYFFNIINGFAGKWEVLDKATVFLAVYFEYILLFGLAVFFILDFKKRWKLVSAALISAVVSRFVVTSLIRILWFRPRPFVNNNINLLINYNPNEASFPSGHASFYFALSTVLFLYNKKIGTIFYIVSFLIVISRIFIGIHWPSDILGGAVIGILIGWLGYKISRKY